MARMMFAVARLLAGIVKAATTPAPSAAAEAALRTSPTDGEARAPWSIERESIFGPGWYDSSWMLERGLDIDENPPAEAIPPQWQWRWWVAAGSA